MKEIKNGIKQSLKGKRKAPTFFFSLLSFSSLIFLSFPQYAIQMISYGGLFPLIAFRELSTNILIESGITGLSLTVIYSILSGILITNLYVTINASGLKQLKFAGALGPGALVGACAACGVGLLPLIGLGAAAAFMPLNGNLWRIGGILILLIAIKRIGNPDICAIPSS